MITVYAPASMANISVGFDVLGAALTPIDGTLLGDCVTVTAAPRFELKLTGRFVDKLPIEMTQNLAYHAWQAFSHAIGEKIPVRLCLEKNMPIASGLGSSACSIVASLVAINEFCGQPLGQNRLLQLMGELEGHIAGSIHYDNVAPCYLGGMQLILGDEEQICQSVPVFTDWLWVMAYPATPIATAEARAVLPMEYPREKCIQYGRNLAGFVHACHTQQPLLAAKLMQDVLAEPYRIPLLSGFSQARDALLDRGALACGISGSGPTLFAVTDDPHCAEQLADWLTTHYLQHPDAFLHICRLDTTGARRLE